jgi:signal transduction histidine kinase
MQNLEMSKDALIQSEKLAALGGLVAGVAHELNTPIGNSLLSATSLAQNAREFAQEVDIGLRRSTLTRFLSTNQEGTTILLRNLERAAELIRSFKQVAVDQTSSQRRTFDLKEVIGEIVVAYMPMFRAAAIEVHIDIPEQVALDSYPGPLGQVLGNLLTNSVVHGFEGRGHGAVRVSAQLSTSKKVTIKVTDDGQGISPKNLAQIFNPFFTTRLGKGGSGLGLSIVHNIVTGVLGGTVLVKSEEGTGTTFSVCVPLIAPIH